MRLPIFIAFSDLHIHDFNSFNENKRRTKIAFEVLETMAGFSLLHKAPVLFLGDMFNTDQNLSNFIIDIFTEKFPNESFKHGLYAITGNHDQAEININVNYSPSYIKSFARVFPNLHCLDFKSKSFGNVYVHGIPYITYNLNFVNYVEAIHIRPRTKNILMIHTDLYGAMDTDGRVVDSVENLPKDLNKLFRKFDLVLCGHIHKPQKVTSAKNAYMIGSPNQLRKSDKDCSLGYWKIYDDMTVEFKELKFPGFKEGEKKDDYNFWYQKTEKINKSENKILNFNTESRIILANKYCKITGVKDKSMIRELKHVLKNA